MEQDLAERDGKLAETFPALERVVELELQLQIQSEGKAAKEEQLANDLTEALLASMSRKITRSLLRCQGGEGGL